MSKIKIMHLLQSTRFSGAENVVCQIMNLFRNDNEYEMIYVSPNGQIANSLKEREINYFPMESFSRAEINRVVKEINPDIIHAHDFNASVRASRYKDKKVISHLHNNPLWLSKFDIKTITYAMTVKRYCHIIGVSNAVKDEFRYKKLLADKFTVLPNVVDADKVLQLGMETIDEEFDILFVGRLSPQKNPLGFIQIIKEIKEKYSKTLNVAMIGEGTLIEDVRAKIKENGLEDTVSLKGFVTNPYKYMKHSKVVAMPSIWEGFGLVAVEAMMLGTPVVAYPVGGLKDIVDENSGMLCSNQGEMVETVLKLLTSDEFRIKTGINATNRAKQFSDVESYKQLLKKIYDSVEIGK